MAVRMISILCCIHRAPHSTARRCAERSPWPLWSPSNADMADTHEILSSHLVDLTPSAHDPAVVVRDDGDDVDPIAFQLLDVLDVRREVVGLAAGREGAREGDEHDLLAFPLLGGVVFLRHAASGWVVVGDRCPSSSVLLAEEKMKW